METKQRPSESTMAFYRRIVRNLGSPDAAEDARAFGAILGARLQDAARSRSSFKIYASAIRTVLLTDGWREALGGFEAALGSAARPPVKKRGNLKFVPTEVRDAILAQLAKREAKYSAQVSALIVATALCGLRPKEWRGASLIVGSAPKLVVQNGKYRPPGTVDERSVIKNARRGNGPERTLLIEGEGQDRTAVVEAIREALRWERERPWSDHQRAIRRELSAAVRDLIRSGEIPALYGKLTPYSFRHQAAADAKASFDVGSGEAAALLGHASARTAVASYGRPRMGRSGMRVKAAEKSVDLVDNLDIGSEGMSRLEAQRSNDQPAPRGGRPFRQTQAG